MDSSRKWFELQIAGEPVPRVVRHDYSGGGAAVVMGNIRRGLTDPNFVDERGQHISVGAPYIVFLADRANAPVPAGVSS